MRPVFLKRHHVGDPAFLRVVDELDIPVSFWFEEWFSQWIAWRSKYLLLLADKIDEIKTICQFCKKKATMVLRTQDGVPSMANKFRSVEWNLYPQSAENIILHSWNQYENVKKMNIYDQLQAVEDRYEELLSDPGMFLTPSDSWALKKSGFNCDTVTAYREYKQVLQNIVDAEEMD